MEPNKVTGLPGEVVEVTAAKQLPFSKTIFVAHYDDSSEESISLECVPHGEGSDSKRAETNP